MGRWEREEHERAFAESRYAYFLGKRSGQPVGFVIVREWAAKDRVTYIKRIIVSEPGKGTGRELLTKVVDAIFDQTEAHRVWLGVLSHNTRAQRVYQAIGFRSEGVACGSAFFDDEYFDEVRMAVLRPEWRRQK